MTKLEPGERKRDTRTVPPERFTKKTIWVGVLVFGLICVGIINYMSLSYWRGQERGWIAGVVLAALSLTLIDSGYLVSRKFAASAPVDSGAAATRGAWLAFSYGFPRLCGAILAAWAAAKMTGLDFGHENEYTLLIKGAIAGAIVTFALGAVIFSKIMESARGEGEGPPEPPA